ncbi:MAG: hypothetical protein F6K55_34980 [Moorea sp. SIO4A3]|nr:hypothetical protein [Moorena sp. SIO4A3]
MSRCAPPRASKSPLGRTCGMGILVEWASCPLQFPGKQDSHPTPIHSAPQQCQNSLKNSHTPHLPICPHSLGVGGERFCLDIVSVDNYPDLIEIKIFLNINNQGF